MRRLHGLRDPRAVHPDVDAAELSHCSPDGGGDGFFARGVHSEEEGAEAGVRGFQGAGELGEAAGVNVGEGEVGDAG